MKLFLSVIIFLFCTELRADDIADLKKRMDELEARQFESYIHQDQNKKVSTYFADKVSLGGFFNGGLRGFWGPDTLTQITNDQVVLGINIGSDFGNNFSLSTQFVNVLDPVVENRHNDPRAVTLGLPQSRLHTETQLISVLTQAYLQYSFSRFFKLQLGQGFPPFGYVFEVLDPVLFLRNRGPLIFRESRPFTRFWTGLHLYGSTEIKSGELGYDLYTFTPPDPAHEMGLGGRVWFSNIDESVITGLSAQVGQDEEESFENIGADLRLTLGRFQMQTEYFERISHVRESTWSAYAEPGIWVKDNVIAFVFTDYLYNTVNRTQKSSTTITDTNSIADPYQVWANGVGVNWLPRPHIRLRLTYSKNNYMGSRATLQGQNRDFDIIEMSAGASF